LRPDVPLDAIFVFREWPLEACSSSEVMKSAVTLSLSLVVGAWITTVGLGASDAIDHRPVAGDADFPTENASERHVQKIGQIKSGRFDLVLIGDSITHTVGEMPGGIYEPLKEVWDRHFAPRNAINLGHNGFRTENILWNLLNGELDFHPSPKVVVILIGTNNTDDRNFPTVHTAEQVAAGTKAIVDLIRQRHPSTKILLLRIFPRGGDQQQGFAARVFHGSPNCLKTVEDAGLLTAGLADHEHVFWLDVNSTFLRPDGTINTDLMPDLLHPNLAGAEAWAQAIEPTLSQLMGEEPVRLLKPPVPTPQQVAWHEAGVGLFFHWAPNVYQGREADDLSTPRDQINPDRFNADQWVEAVRAANAGYMIFVAKHGGGYCAWQTQSTDYSLKSSPWRQGRGDMLGDLAKACDRQKVDLGVYLCPYDETHGAGNGGRTKAPEAQAAYNAVYRQQLTEILTQYGPMFEMWFDGGNVVPINDLIERYSPGIIAFQGRRAGGSRWVGTEHGFAPYPCWNTIPWKEGETPQEGAGSPSGNAWFPAECDVSMLRPRWFWSPGSDTHILSLESLIEIYYQSVGRGVNLLLNVTPDGHGEVPTAQMRRLREFGDEIRLRFGHPLETTQGHGYRVILDWSREELVDHVVVREDIRKGERVRKFKVEGLDADGQWKVLVEGRQIGVRQIIPIHPVKLTAVRCVTEVAVAEPQIQELSVLRVGRPVPPIAYR